METKQFTIDLNVDVGEGFPLDAQLLALVSSCNIACGGHVGDAQLMEKTLLLAQQNNVTVGAHPSYPDKVFFGRKEMQITPELLFDSLCTQVQQLLQIAQQNNILVKYLKPHGALYNKAAIDEVITQVILNVCKKFHLPLMGLSGSFMEIKAGQQGIKFIKESFADRKYHCNGTLVSRNHPGGLITSVTEVCSQVQQMVFQQQVTTLEGTMIDLQTESICFHGDHSEALILLDKVTRELQQLSVVIKSAI